MSITLDAAHSAMLRGQLQSVVLKEENGEVLGRFFPQLTPEQVRILEPQLSEEELERLDHEPTYSTAEVIAYLESLDAQGQAGGIDAMNADSPLYVERRRLDENGSCG
jgi:hypothetical protein